jgi:release factor glutamine methyltransferase
MSAPSLRALWLSARARLAALPKAEAERDARLLIQAALRLTPAGFTARLSDPAPDDPQLLAHLEWMVSRRAARWPVSRILGEAVFWGRSFEVTAATLSPRGDTETLIAAALEAPFTRLLDLGTGTGCIAVTLLAERTQACGVATDIDADALAVAARNAARHGVTDRLVTQRANWTDGVAGPFDLIVSNPPYITADAFAALEPEVRNHDPAIALTPGGDGLAAYRALCATAPALLSPGGRMILEIGHDQGPAVAALMRSGGLEHVEIRPDLAGRDRIVLGCVPVLRL